MTLKQMKRLETIEERIKKASEPMPTTRAEMRNRLEAMARVMDAVGSEIKTGTSNDASLEELSESDREAFAAYYEAKAAALRGAYH